MTLYLFVKYLHVLGAIVILGTGSGIAFFMLMAHRSGDVAFTARTAAIVVLADMLFTLTAVILQPITGGLSMTLSQTTARCRSVCWRRRPRRHSSLYRGYRRDRRTARRSRCE